jgi:hypothetical protein
MKLQDLTKVLTEQRDVLVPQKADVVVGTTTEQVRVLTAQDKYEEFDEPQELGCYTSNAVVAAERNDLTPIFESFLGREVDFVMDFHNGDRGWYSIDADWVLTRWAKVLGARATRPNFMFTISKMFPSHDDAGNITTYDFNTIASGQGDTAYQRLADKLVQYGFNDVLLRIGHEMDGTFRGRYCARGKESVWIAAYRRIVDVMRARQPGLRFKPGICPTNEWVSQLGADWLEKVYPGDGYVDWVGLDIYDMHWSLYPTITPTTTEAQRLAIWQRTWNDNWFLKQLNATRDFAKAHGKPLSIPEWGAMYFMNGGLQRCGVDNPYWMEQMCKWILDPANGVAHHSYFNNSRGDYRPGTTVDGAFTCRLSDPYPGTGGDSYPTLFPRAAEIFKRYLGGKKKRYFRASGLVEG